ncbi:MAG: CinA family nicotinamide mononucleotide deamidase-related protein [Anaerolineae bacterium]|nr:CinA family nicotinamide mononucleotide deamidase-related protein [Anaerolineae bacterium]
MNAEIVSIGTEILLGEINDTNSTYIARTLRDIGVNVYYMTSVGDNLDRITSILKLGLQRSDLIITTGGLGPTVDDVTRDAAAAATNRKLVFHQHLLDMIAARFRGFGAQMTENNRQQAMIPENAIILENPVGTAPCYIIEDEPGILISLPGVPSEMKFLMQNRVVPYLQQKMGLPAIIKALVLRTAGIGESAIDHKIGDLMKLSNPTVGLAAHTGQTDIRITARADTEAEADAMIATVESQVRALVGDYIYGTNEDKIETAVMAALHSKHMQLAVCEIGTQGAVNRRLQNTGETAGNGLKAIDQYPDVAALRDAVGYNEENLETLATRCVEYALGKYNVPLALAIIHDGENGAIALATPEKIRARNLHLGGDPNDVAKWAGNWGLGLLWHYLAKQ